jgi:short-subunit dehydrogenase
VADLSDPARAAGLAAETWDAFGHLDILVNNAGIPMRRPVSRLTMEEVERVMRVNYLSPVAMALAVLPRMTERGSGTIVNVSSLGGRLGITTEAAYSASKFALCGFSEAMAADIDGTGVKVRLVLPGAIDTEIWDQPGNDAPLYDGPKDPPSEIAQGIADAIDSETFEHYLPDMKAVAEMKTSDFDSFLVGMRALTERAQPGEAP